MEFWRTLTAHTPVTVTRLIAFSLASTKFMFSHIQSNSFILNICKGAKLWTTHLSYGQHIFSLATTVAKENELA